MTDAATGRAPQTALVRFTGRRCPVQGHKRWDGWPPDTPEALAGRPVRIHLPPVQCGSEWVWRVSDGDVLALAGRLPQHGHIVVCAHEVEVD